MAEPVFLPPFCLFDNSHGFMGLCWQLKRVTRAELGHSVSRAITAGLVAPSAAMCVSAYAFTLTSACQIDWPGAAIGA